MPQVAPKLQRAQLIAGFSHRKEAACDLNEHEDDNAKQRQPSRFMDEVADTLAALFCRHVTPTTLRLILHLRWQRGRLLRVHWC